MKIYLLRHEERFEPPAFYTNLTPNGLENSVKLKDILNKEKIDIIYSSPFLRVLQTIMPYCLENNLQQKVNVEYSLYETMQDNCFIKGNHKIELKNTDKEFLLANPDYMSFITINAIKCPEENIDVKMRVNMFMRYIFNKYQYSNLNILIASHAGVLGEIENYKYDKGMYPQGGVMLLYDDKDLYCNKPINY
jgi:broad specificity phosphatase PhoE